MATPNGSDRLYPLFQCVGVAPGIDIQRFLPHNLSQRAAWVLIFATLKAYTFRGVPPSPEHDCRP